MMGTTSSGTLIVLFGIYVFYIRILFTSTHLTPLTSFGQFPVNGCETARDIGCLAALCGGARGGLYSRSPSLFLLIHWNLWRVFGPSPHSQQ